MAFAAMDDGIGVLEAFAKSLVQQNRGTSLPGPGIHEPQFDDEERHLAGMFTDAEGIERIKRVGTELDASTHFAEFRRPL